MPEPTTGVSLANKVVFDYLPQLSQFKIEAINTSFDKFDEDLGKFSFSKFIFYLKQNLYCYKIFNSDIIYLTPGQTFFGVLKYAVFILLARLLNKQIVVHIHGNHIGNEFHSLTGLKKKIFKALVSKSNKGIVLSESLTGNMTPFINSKSIYVLYNFVEDFLFEKPKAYKEEDSSVLRIVYLSNLMEEKGILDLLGGLKLLEEKGIAYEAKIAGAIDKKQETQLLRKMASLKGTEYIGIVKGDQKKELLYWSNVFVLPTFYAMEGQPISILEAMATGNVILTTEHAGIPDVFKDEVNGFYVAKRSGKSIYDQLEFLSNNEQDIQRISEHNVIEANSKYKVNVFINKFVKIIED
ncbi:MAG: hypothetical protein BM564_02250 [Bacteroidetes bacterium MedPE-SWsnd-G2]|nr:MAG: hypothetical protein BM564_02250 [Bacteroidetes bacterium MedPE-SWsnd-G2]